MPTNQTIDQLLMATRGTPATSAEKSSLSMLPYADASQIVTDTQSQVKSDAISEARKQLQQLTSGMGLGSEEANYLSGAMNMQGTLEDAMGLKEAEQNAQKLSQYATQLSSAAPTMDTLYTGMLKRASPTFLGATRENVENYFKELMPNPLERQQAVENYMSASKQSFTASLKALNSLYETSVLAAQGAADNEQKRYDNIASKVKDLWSEISFVGREHLQQEHAIELENTKNANKTVDYGLDPSDPIYMAVNGLGSVSAADRSLDVYAKLKQQGKDEEANKFLNSIAYNSLSGTQKDEFTSYSTAATELDRVMSGIDKFKKTNPGLYKSMFESAKPLTGASKDPEWVKFTSMIENAQGEIRKSRYGTAVTNAEKNTGKMLFVDFGADDISTIEKKMNTLRTLADDYRNSVLEAAQGNYYGIDNGGQGGTVVMKGPKGTFNVPSDKVELFKQNGYTEQ